MKRLFGTDGIRGHAGEYPLDEDTVRRVGASLARRISDRLGRPAVLLTGRDTRESGEWIERAFHTGAASHGAVCRTAQVITTPGIAYLTKAFDFDAGIVISASHNPYKDNGLKIFAPSGKKLEDAAERLIEGDLEQRTDDVSGSSVELDDSRAAELRRAYTDHLVSEGNALDLDGFKMVVDCANGAACEFAPRIFRHFGADVIAINDRPDGTNINLDCGSMHLEPLRARVLAEKADFGVAFDGDADRALFVDEKGNIVDGDATLWIMARYLKDHGKLAGDLVIATVMSNLGLELALKNEGIEMARAAVGDKYVLEELLRTGAAIGGEQSGHVIFPAESLVGDGIMTTLFLLRALREKRMSLSEIGRGLTRCPQVLINVPVREKVPFDDVAAIAERSAEVSSELDGTGRLLLRYSGTEKLARVMIEGTDQALIESMANDLAAVIRENLG